MMENHPSIHYCFYSAKIIWPGRVTLYIIGGRMKNKNIRKEGLTKKERRASSVKDDGNVEVFNFKSKRATYQIIHDRYESTIRSCLTGEILGVYKAASRRWKIGKEPLPTAIITRVEAYYS